MNSEEPDGAVKVKLPSGAEVLVRAGTADGGSLASVGLVEAAALDETMNTIGEAATLLRQRLEPLMPTKATVEFGVSFEAKGGKLVALLFEGKAQAALTITLEWERPAT